MSKITKSEQKILFEKKCACCGKTFVRISFNEYAWKRGSKYFCSYGCMRKWETK